MRPANGICLLWWLCVLACMAGLVRAIHHHHHHHQQQSDDEEVLSVDPKGSSFDESDKWSAQPTYDPFAFTFDDYLREASKTGAGSSLSRKTSIDDTEPSGNSNNNNNNKQPQQAQIAPSSAGLVIENDDENLLLASGRKTPIIDYIFPPSSAIAAPVDSKHHESRSESRDDAAAATMNSRHQQHVSANDRSPNSISTNNSKQPTAENNNNNNSSSNNNDNNNNNNNNNDLINEIKLLFAWKSLPTNKCSKTCGKGFRLNHLSCVDLKYDVRVEDELCLKSRLIKPGELGDEPCNEVDCEPHWASIEFQQCNPSTATSGECEPNLYKRIECVMINRLGQTVHMDESSCNSTSRADPKAKSSSNHNQWKDEASSRDKQLSNDEDVVLLEAPASTSISSSTSSSSSSPLPPLAKTTTSEDLGTDLDEQVVDGKVERNNEIIFSNYQDSPGNNNNDLPLRPDPFATWLSSLNGKHSNRHLTHNEPFYEPAEWSECAGAPCGQLGRRYRKLTCRIYLTRSAKFADLPESSCHSAAQPDREEPCYMDCAPEADLVGHLATNETASSSTIMANHSNHSNDNTSTSDNKQHDNEDEIVYDLEMTRYVWRHASWTKCSAECMGGKSESIVECWDKVAEAMAPDTKLCDSTAKPNPIIETCNEVPCPPEWRVEPFSNCSRPCGSAGIKTRSVACVQQVPIQTGSSSYMLVSNDLCIQSNGTMPHKIEPCNRHDCRPEWSVGPWSECSRKCGEGVRNRTVICVQEFASRDGSIGRDGDMSSAKQPYKIPSPDLLETIAIGAKNWYPGKAIQVPFHECYEEYRTVPPLDERCFSYCHNQPYIDSDPRQNHRITQEAFKRRTITLKVGGKAQIVEGKNLKIRCRVINKLNDHFNNRRGHYVEWQKDGVRIFSDNSTVAERQYVPLESDNSNSIIGNDVLDSDDRLQADEPEVKRNAQRQLSHGLQSTSSPQATKSSSKGRNLRVRSWNSFKNGQQTAPMQFQFVPQYGGRFSLVKENTLRIKRLRHDDSGIYTCFNGQLKESIEIKVIGRDHLVGSNDEKLVNYY